MDDERLSIFLKRGVSELEQAEHWYQVLLPQVKEICRAKVERHLVLQERLNSVCDEVERQEVLNQLRLLKAELFEYWDNLLRFVSEWPVLASYSLTDQIVSRPIRRRTYKLVRSPMRPPKPLQYIEGTNPLEFHDIEESVIYLVPSLYSNRPNHCVKYDIA